MGPPPNMHHTRPEGGSSEPNEPLPGSAADHVTMNLFLGCWSIMRRFVVAMISLQTKFKVSSFTHSKDMIVGALIF